eukprot:9964243-Ditylum_brightwellii.AAC.1
MIERRVEEHAAFDGGVTGNNTEESGEYLEHIEDSASTSTSSVAPPSAGTSFDGRNTEHELMTTFEGSNGSLGAMFDVVTKPKDSS